MGGRSTKVFGFVFIIAATKSQNWRWLSDTGDAYQSCHNQLPRDRSHRASEAERQATRLDADFSGMFLA